MGNTERRMRIMRILSRRKHETIANLAHELGVSTRTIRRDVDELSLTEPIYTQAGRYGGGVYVMNDYRMDRMYMEEDQLAVLIKLSKQANHCLSANETKILLSIIEQYAKPKIQNNVC